jgi:hypothetical protein
MQQLIASYLFNNRQCYIPGVGELQVKRSSAVYDPGDQRMAAPTYEVVLQANAKEDSGFIGYIAKQFDITIEDAQQRVQQFCAKQFTPNTEYTIPVIGTFQVDENGKIKLASSALQTLPSVNATRVLRKDNHAVLVGDKESNTQAMTDFFAHKETKKQYWWIWAAALFIIGAGIITYYFTAGDFTPTFGSKQSIETSVAPTTHKLP